MQTKNGMELKTKPISPMLLQKVQEAIPYPDVPTYEVPLITGGVEKHPHDESTLETDEDKEAWEVYQREMLKAQAERNSKMMELIFSKGIDIELPEDNSWVEEQEYFGVEVPTHPIKRKVHYIQTEVLVSSEDIAEVMLEVLGKTGVKEEDLSSVRRMFQRPLQGDASPGTSAETGGEGDGTGRDGERGGTGVESEGMELQPDFSGDRYSF